jgi:hypothetical protein
MPEVNPPSWVDVGLPELEKMEFGMPEERVLREVAVLLGSGIVGKE